MDPINSNRLQPEGVDSYQNAQNQNPLDMSFSHSINTISSFRDYIVSEDLVAGHRSNGRMSSVRRFFCLFVTFDFLLTSLMWLICVMLKGENIAQALKEQILHYSIHTSLFDLVLTAFFRFIFLLLFYAIFYISHWIVIALSTSITCAFLIGKVFEYDWPHSSQPVFEVLLVLVSFILSWGEAWFLDFRVIPQEACATRYFVTATESERAPLINHYVNSLPSVYTESVANFYSPMGTPEGSLHRIDQMGVISKYPAVHLTREQEEVYKILSAQTLQTAWDLLQKKNWEFIKANDFDNIYCLNYEKNRKIYRLNAHLEVSPRFLLDELFCKVEELPKWNSAIKESHKVQSIDEFTDIVYQISNDGAAGLVSSRDFVTLRHWKLIEDHYVLASVKTEHPSLPVSKKCVRAENGVGCMSMCSILDQPNKCNFVWILNTDLKLFMLKGLIEKELCSMMFKYVRELRQYIEKLTETNCT